jgi:flagellin-like protein
MRPGRKGISEIVAALIMILIVITGSIIVYVYSSGMLGSLQGAQPQTQYSNQIALEYYDWTTALSPTLQRLKLTLRNVGSGRGILAAFYVGNGTTITTNLLPTLSGNCTTVTTTALKPQAICIANLTIPITITRGAAYNVKIVTKDGSVFSYSCIAGQSTGTLS